MNRSHVYRTCLHGALLTAWTIFIFGTARAGEPAAAEGVTLANVVPPGDNLRDEPLAGEFSRERAARFLDSAALEWQKSMQCFTCHTNYAYLMARPSISANAPAHAEVRDFLEKLVAERWETQGPRWDAEVVMSAAVLAFNDAATSGKLHPVTQKAFDRMWTRQRADGGFDWLKCGWPPMESDDHFGATMAAIGVGVAPEGYAQTDTAKVGVEKIRNYLRANPAPTLHHRAMVLWASTYHDGFLATDERKAVVDDLLAKQHADGGWGLASLGDWKRVDNLEQDPATSDGYGTGFVIYVLRRSGLPADDARLQKGIAWLKANQRASGRWFTRSLNKDNKHFITHAGTAFAVMALAACQSLGASAAVAAAGLPDPAKTKPVAVLEVPHYCEGVAFDHAGNGYLSEGDTIWQFTLDGKAREWAKTGAPNGHKVLADGTHLVCDASRHAVLHLSADGMMLEPASKECDGKPLRGPNDLTLDTPHGGFYFSDPGDSSDKQPTGTVHYVDAQGTTHLVDEGLAYPNGIVLTADGKLLYLAESKHNRVLVYQVTAPGQAVHRRV
ncbi:MAG TPA: SMP-30/gluconolactonase/LRE family protein, partial [Pirellulales bacterium]|nr:SMP-30/gluconolactonase/LRE family protein [Pirellulales bacterium]